MKNSRRKGVERRFESISGDASRKDATPRVRLVSERMQWMERNRITLSRSTSEKGSRNLDLLGVAVEGKEKGNDGEKGDGSTTTRNTTTTNDAPFSF